MKRTPKVSQTDYTAAMLPQTRKAVFFDVVQLHWQKLLILGFFLLLSYIPLLLSIAVKDIYISNLSAALADANDGQKMAAGQQLIYLDVLRSAVNILFIAIFALSLSGTMRTVRQYAWMENVHTPTDFPKGIRDNYGQTAAIGALSGLVYTLCLTVYYTASAYSSSLIVIISLLPIALSLLFVMPILAFAIAMIPIYSNTLWGTVKNAFVIYSKTALKSLLFLLVCLSPWIISILPNFYCHLLGSIVAVLLLPASLLAWNLFCYDQFDRHFNPLVCPELIGKGITHESETP